MFYAIRIFLFGSVRMHGYLTIPVPFCIVINAEARSWINQKMVVDQNEQNSWLHAQPMKLTINVFCNHTMIALTKIETNEYFTEEYVQKNWKTQIVFTYQYAMNVAVMSVMA